MKTSFHLNALCWLIISLVFIGCCGCANNSGSHSLPTKNEIFKKYLHQTFNLKVPVEQDFLVLNDNFCFSCRELLEDDISKERELHDAFQHCYNY